MPENPLILRINHHKDTHIQHTMSMKKTILLACSLCTIYLLHSCSGPAQPTVHSPDGKISMSVWTNESGQAVYAIQYKNQPLIEASTLGFEFLDQPALDTGLQIHAVRSGSFSETWEMPWGEQLNVNNEYHYLEVDFREQNSPKRRFSLHIRAYDDGLGFRYVFPRQKNLDEVLITEENTWFTLHDNHLCWWTPGDWDIYEHLYNTTRFSAIDALSKRDHPNLAQTHIPVNAVNTPVTMKTSEGIHLSFHEAALVDYAGITLEVHPEKLAMRSNLVGTERHPYKVTQHTPFQTPWRMIQIADKATDLIESRLILNLNEPNVLGDVSWVRPAKYMGIWWEMHIGKSEWGYAGPDGEPHGRHGATTANAKRYIDFASANGIDALLIEGWYTGWENWIGTADREGIFDFVTPYPDYDLDAVVAYASEKGVRLVMHHETSSAVTTYEQQLDTAYALMAYHGIDMVKTGYVGTIIPAGEYHHGQWMVNHYQRVIDLAAKHRVMVNIHEPIMATGLRRTYPNDATREGLRGQEFNAWASDGGNPPEHLSIVAYTRMLAGPIDYTPGIFNIKIDPYKPNNQVNTTLAHQLAAYVVIYGPMQMAADLPEHYEGHPAFQFIRDVGVNWEQSVVLNGEVGQYVTIAREERETGHWFLGSITNENSRVIQIQTDFLEPGITYDAMIYGDGEDAHWDINPTSYSITALTVNHQDTLTLGLAPGGGVAISFIKQTNQ